MRIIILMIVLSLFLISCGQNGQNISAETQDIGVDTANKSAGITAATACTAHWECFDDEYKVYQLENCTRTQTTKCERGCINGTCRPAEICTVGFKCIDEDRYGYQKEDCSFINKKTCGGGCADNKCIEKPATASNVTESVPALPANSYAQENQGENSTETPKTIRTIQLGEQQEIEISGTKRIISIYNLEPEWVVVKVDGVKSNELSAGEQFTYANIGATIRIEAIMFQAYGIKAIDYSVN